eukprot:scaffold9279_cov159-Amphora_coffeaeformis.AAC.2
MESTSRKNDGRTKDDECAVSLLLLSSPNVVVCFVVVSALLFGFSWNVIARTNSRAPDSNSPA